LLDSDGEWGGERLALKAAPERRMSTGRRAPGDDKPVTLKALDYPLGDDIRHGLGRLGFREPRIAGQRHSDAND
jgi:hypothetical protein